MNIPRKINDNKFYLLNSILIIFGTINTFSHQNIISPLLISAIILFMYFVLSYEECTSMFLPMVLISGTFRFTTTLSIAMIIYAIRFFRNFKIDKKYLLLYLIFCVATYLHYFQYIQYPNTSLYKFTYKYIYNMINYALIFFFLINKNYKIYNFVLIIKMFILYTFLLLIIQSINNSIYFGLPFLLGKTSGRLGYYAFELVPTYSSIFANPNYVAIYSLISIFGILSIFFIELNKKQKIIYFIICILIIYLTLLTLSKAYLLCISILSIVGLIYSIYKAILRNNFTYMKLYTCAIILILLLIFIINSIYLINNKTSRFLENDISLTNTPPIKTNSNTSILTTSNNSNLKINNPIVSTINRFSSTKSGITTGRFNIFKIYNKMIIENPISLIFGRGFQFYDMQEYEYYPHMALQEIFVYGGILGLIYFLTIIFLYYKNMIIDNKEKISGLFISLVVIYGFFLQSIQFFISVFISKTIILIMIIFLQTSKSKCNNLKVQ